MTFITVDLKEDHKIYINFKYNNNNNNISFYFISEKRTIIRFCECGR
jgi:hypothetical protein